MPDFTTQELTLVRPYFDKWRQKTKEGRVVSKLAAQLGPAMVVTLTQDPGSSWSNLLKKARRTWSVVKDSLHFHKQGASINTHGPLEMPEVRIVDFPEIPLLHVGNRWKKTTSRWLNVQDHNWYDANKHTHHPFAEPFHHPCVKYRYFHFLNTRGEDEQGDFFESCDITEYVKRDAPERFNIFEAIHNESKIQEQKTFLLEARRRALARNQVVAKDFFKIHPELKTAIRMHEDFMKTIHPDEVREPLWLYVGKNGDDTRIQDMCNRWDIVRFEIETVMAYAQGANPPITLTSQDVELYLKALAVLAPQQTDYVLWETALPNGHETLHKDCKSMISIESSSPVIRVNFSKTQLEINKDGEDNHLITQLEQLRSKLAQQEKMESMERQKQEEARFRHEQLIKAYHEREAIERHKAYLKEKQNTPMASMQGLMLQQIYATIDHAQKLYPPKPVPSPLPLTKSKFDLIDSESDNEDPAPFKMFSPPASDHDTSDTDTEADIHLGTEAARYSYIHKQ